MLGFIYRERESERVWFWSRAGTDALLATRCSIDANTLWSTWRFLTIPFISLAVGFASSIVNPSNLFGNTLTVFACLSFFFFFGFFIWLKDFPYYSHLDQINGGVCVSVPDHLFKGDCKSIFSERGCSLCLQIFDDATALAHHQNKCLLSPPLPLPLPLVS